MLKGYKDIKDAFFEKKDLETTKELSSTDLEYMSSLSSAVLYKRSALTHWVLIAFFTTITLFLIWAYFADIDEISRGQGRVVPSGQNQIVQNLEGGVVSELFVHEGDSVKKGQILLRISNEKSTSTQMSNEIKAKYFQAQIQRLEAELKRVPFEPQMSDDEELNSFLANEKELYATNTNQLSSKIAIFLEQIAQKQNQLRDTKQTIEHLKFSVQAIDKEVAMTEPMVEKGIRSQVDFLKLQREQSDAKQKLSSAVLSIDKTNSEIAELSKKIKETNEDTDSKTREKLNQTITSLKDVEANILASSDQLLRTTVKAPTNGVVQKLYVNTIGGSVKPAQDLLEIVPTDTKLIIETKVLPKDIAFIYHAQKAKIKFSAFDFSIYGGLEGRVINISPDTITEKDNKTFYIVNVETDQNYIEKNGDKKFIIPGMVADVDIITGKKSVLNYILKPILKTKTYTFTER